MRQFLFYDEAGHSFARIAPGHLHLVNFPEGGRVVEKVDGSTVQSMHTAEAFELFLEKAARDHAWKPLGTLEEFVELPGSAIAPDAINPSHYQAYFKSEDLELQWLETMQHSGRYAKKPEEFKAALELQVRKYLDRNGGKDTELQELRKGLWYLKFLVAFIENGNKPVRVCDIK